MKGSRSGDDRRRVVVTGIGLVTSLGRGREPTWSALRQGQVRVWPLASREASDGPIHHGFPAPYAERFIDGFDPSPLLLQDCLREAVADAEEGADETLVDDPGRVAVLVGLSKGRMLGLERLHRRWVEVGNFAEVFTNFWPNAGAASVSRLLGARGPCLAPVAACATGLVAAIQGSEMIARGECDAAVVGAVDASLSPFLLGAFRSMRALASVEEGEDARRAIRPWDRTR